MVKSRWILMSVVLALGLFAVACGDDGSGDGGGGSGGAAGTGGGGSGGTGGTGGSGGSGGAGDDRPCTLTGLQDPTCQSCLMDAVNGCPLAGASCLLGGTARQCIQDNACATLELPPQIDYECIFTNCFEEVLDANNCMVDKCPAYAKCFP